MEPDLRIRGVRSSGRGRDLRIEHRHGERWLEMVPDRPELTVEKPAQWRTRYVCRCGFSTDSLVPS